MSDHKIPWLNMPGFKGETWNPIVGCSKISEGCENCYAERMANRIAGIARKKEGIISWTQRAYLIATGHGWSSETSFAGTNNPLKWKSPRMIFVCSMGDLFHESVPSKWLEYVFETIIDCPQHIFVILTKRPERAKEFLKYRQTVHTLPNVWLGVTAENQQRANERIPILLQIPAAVRFVSVEPMLGPVDLTYIKAETPSFIPRKLSNGHLIEYNVKSVFVKGIDWVICGGESGPKARPMHPEWVRSLRDQCQAAQVPFFFKQWGEWITGWKNYIEDAGIKFKHIHDTPFKRVGHKKAGHHLDGKEHFEFPKGGNQ